MRTLVALAFVSTLELAEDAAPPKSDPAAEDLVKKVETKIASAKTVSMKFKTETVAGDKKSLSDVSIDDKVFVLPEKKEKGK